MKHEKKESAFVGRVELLAGIFGALIAVGLLFPETRPLAYQAGSAFSLVIIGVGLCVAIYAGWRIATFPYRRRRAWLRTAEIRGVGPARGRPAATRRAQGEG